jgi:hypothetical protein
VPIEHPGFVRSDQGTCGLPLAKTQPGSGRAGRLDSQWRNPTTIRHDYWAAGKPVAIVDDDVRIALTLDGNEMGTEHGAPPLRACPDSQRPSNLAAQGGAPKSKLVDRARQRQGLKTGHGKIFNQAETHESLASRESATHRHGWLKRVTDRYKVRYGAPK